VTNEYRRLIDVRINFLNRTNPAIFKIGNRLRKWGTRRWVESAWSMQRGHGAREVGSRKMGSTGEPGCVRIESHHDSERENHNTV
jgi:hypothetical protein